LNILDENIIASQRAQLKKWRIRFSQIGTEIGRQGMKDQDDILPLLHRSRSPTFFTHDLGFFDPSMGHQNYCVVCLDVPAKETAAFIRRLLRHSEFRNHRQRLGKVILWRVKETYVSGKSENRG
jgi:hypothetical protein